MLTRCHSVLMKPGAMQFTRTCGANALDIILVKP